VVPANNPRGRKTEYESLLKRGLGVPSDEQVNKLSTGAHSRGREEQGVDVDEGGVGGIHAARDVHRRGRADQEGGGYEHENENDRRRDARDADADDTRVVEAPDVVDGRGGGQTEGGGTEGGGTAADVEARDVVDGTEGGRTEGGGTEGGETEGGGTAANVDGTEGGGTAADVEARDHLRTSRRTTCKRHVEGGGGRRKEGGSGGEGRRKEEGRGEGGRRKD